MARKLGTTAVSTADLERAVDVSVDLLKKYAPEFTSDTSALSDLDESRAELADALIESLGSDVILARETGSEADIELKERDQEVAKKALIHLRTSQLHGVALDLGLDAEGGNEALAERIAARVGFDETEVARLVLEHEEPRPDRGHSTRLFPVDLGELSFEGVRSRLVPFQGRYVRVGVARWLIVSSVAGAESDDVVMTGRYRWYDAVADERGGEFQLHAPSYTAGVRVELVHGGPLVEVVSRGATEARAAVRAFQAMTGVQRRDAVPDFRVPEGEALGWDRRSVLFLDLLNSRLARDGRVRVFDLERLGFETAEAPGEIPSRRPAVRNVRLQGQHLLSSRAACELLVSGQTLTEATVRVIFRPSDSTEEAILPITLSIARDHAAVLTAFGAVAPSISMQLHRAVVGQLRASLIDGISDPRGLARLVGEVERRARETRPVEVADILAPNDEDLQDGKE